MNNSIHENPSIDILNELKIAGNYQIIAYKENQFNEISKINLNHIENLQYLKPFISNSSNESQYDVAALVHLLSLQRNKMRILALLKKRCDQLKIYRWNSGTTLNSTIKSRISDDENDFFNKYCHLIDEYNSNISKKLNIPDFDVCNQSVINITQNNYMLCQIQDSNIISKNYLNFDNEKLDVKSQDVFYNSGSFSFFNRDEVSSLKKKLTIMTIQND